MICTIDIGLLCNITVAAITALIAFLNYKAFVKFSDINIDSSVQALMLDKAKECNGIYEESIKIRFSFVPYPPMETSLSKVIEEIIISIQLLDNSLDYRSYGRKKKEKRRNYYLLQFWIQLDTDVRGFFKNIDIDGISPEIKNDTFKKQINDVIITFKNFFEKY